MRRQRHTAERTASRAAPHAHRRAAHGALATALTWMGIAVAACTPELGERPFACDASGLCPDGYRCEATVCVADGVQPTIARPMRVAYINRSEMFWFPSTRGGANLLVNDGFTPGALGIYEIHVSPEGAVTGPTQLLAFRGDRAVSSTVLQLDEDRYAAVTMSFPKDLDDDLEIVVHTLPRDGSGVAAGELYRASYPYFGGYEPAYVGAALVGDGLVFAFANADAGGAVLVTRLSKTGEVLGELAIDLPPEILPLSADCLLWRAADASLTLRVGLTDQRVYTLDLDEGTATMLPQHEGLPVFGFGRSVAYLESDEDAGTGSYVLRDVDGDELGRSPSFPSDGSIEPYTAVPYGAGALIAPLPPDEALSSIDVGYIAPDGSFAKVGGIERPGDDFVYTARAFATEGKVYVAWTSFHEQLMDLWVGVSPLSGVQ